MDVFVYGTLLFSPVREVVLGRATDAQPAELEGFARRCLRGVVYPGIVAAAGHSVVGAVVPGLGAADLDRLDTFEDDFYERRRVHVVAGGIAGVAETYVVASSQAHRMEDRPWTPEDFEKTHLAAFLRAIGAHVGAGASQAWAGRSRE